MRPTMPKQKDLAPVRTFGKVAARCSAQAGAYGKCVASNYENVERNMCQKEFSAFKACVQEKLGRKCSAAHLPHAPPKLSCYIGSVFGLAAGTTLRTSGEENIRSMKSLKQQLKLTSIVYIGRPTPMTIGMTSVDRTDHCVLTMSESVDTQTLKAELLASPGCPSWMVELLSTVPGSPADVVPHNKAKHPRISNHIADAFLHPAVEACLHLINADLFSAHFLVRKAQGGAKYIDWLHAILHKLEGDFRNAKMWYTDLANSTSCPAFAQFWSTSADDKGAKRCVVALTAAQHTDLVALTSAKPGTFRPEEYFESTTASANKIKDSGAAHSLADLQNLVDTNAAEHKQKATDIMKLELVWLLCRMQSEFGWAAMDSAQTTAALQEQAQRKDADPNSTQRKDQAHDMIFGATGQRKF